MSLRLLCGAGEVHRSAVIGLGLCITAVKSSTHTYQSTLVRRAYLSTIQVLTAVANCLLTYILLLTNAAQSGVHLC